MTAANAKWRQIPFINATKVPKKAHLWAGVSWVLPLSS